MRSLWILAVFIITVCGRSPAQELSCAVLDTKDAQMLRDFLRQQQKLRQSLCLPSVIKRLGQIHDLDAIPLLVIYLDYMDPKTAPLPNGGATVRPSYPAVTAIFLIGKPAVIQLLSAIQTGASAKFRKNAVRAYADIFRDDLSSGIRGLKTAELLAKSDDERHRLNEALHELMDECNNRDQQAAQACKDL